MKKPSFFLNCSGIMRVFALFLTLSFFPGLNVAPLAAGDILLHDNGPLITSFGDGPEGSDVSLIQTTALGLITTGFAVSSAVSSIDNARVADDFEVTHPDGWKINKLVFFAYQIDSGTVSPMTSVNYLIWDGHPDDPDSNVIFGDTETNRMDSSSWTNIYRYSDLTQPENRTRWPIMEVTADVGSEELTLQPGTYWLDWQIDGSEESVYQPPVTLLGETVTGNAVWFIENEWISMLDFGTNTPQGAPFKLLGTTIHTVSFNAQEGSTPVPGSKQVVFGQPYGDLATTHRTGYTFTGWFTQAAGGELVTPETIVETAGDHTLYARWSANQYTLSFNPQNGSTPVPESKQVVFGQPYGDLATTHRTGYTFTGWFTQAAGGELVTSETIVETAGDHTLYARWSPKYTVIFDPQGGTPPNPSSKTVTFGQAYGLLPATSLDEYFFAGWFTSPSGGDRVTAGTIVTRNEDHVLYAQWSDRKIILPHLPLLLLD